MPSLLFLLLLNWLLRHFYCSKIKNDQVSKLTKLRKRGLATRLIEQFKPPMTFLVSTSNKVTKVSHMLPYSPAISFDLPFPIPIIYYNSDRENLKMSVSVHFTQKYLTDFHKNWQECVIWLLWRYRLSKFEIPSKLRSKWIF